MKQMAALLMIVALPAFAHDRDKVVVPEQERVINLATELLPWCRYEAESRYIAKNITPYQWSASYHDRSNVLYVNGRLRVHGDDIAVRCRIARGARERYAIIEIDDPTLKEDIGSTGGSSL
jgi:hypothetical protein